MKLVSWIVGLLLAVLILCAVFVHSGAYDVAADVPHWTITHSVMEKVRIASVQRRSAHIEVPPLDDATLIAAGAGNYDAMCAGCHLQPGVEATEMSRGLYPAPPNLATRPLADPAAAFWVIKHGINMTGMPGFALIEVPDQEIWTIAAFVKKLPAVSEGDYKAWSAPPVVTPLPSPR